MKNISYILLLLICVSCQHPANKKEKSRTKTHYVPESYSEPIVSYDNYYYENQLETTLPDHSYKTTTTYDYNSAVLNMEVENGVRYVWIEINGIKLRFVFDTGASSICISPVEAAVLYRQGTLREEDFIGAQYFQDATGRISEGTKINLRTVTLGDVILYNVEATIIDNIHAPLLLGQSALEQFGSIEIDNRNNQIILK